MKLKYDDYMPEMLKMRDNGKTNAEITAFINEKDENFNATESSVKGAIKRHLDKVNEKAQSGEKEQIDEKEQTDTAKTVPENQEGVQETEKQEKAENDVQENKQEQVELFLKPAKEAIEKIFVLCEEVEENFARQKETATLMEENYSRQKEAAVLQEQSLENLAKLEAKYEESIEKHAILNGTLRQTIIQNKEKRRNRSVPYLIIGGFILTMTLAMVVGYNSRRYNNPTSLHYYIVIAYILGGVIAGIGIGIVKKKITAMLEKKK